MAVEMYEIDKFFGNGDFSLWSKKIKIILINQKALQGLDYPKSLPGTLTAEEKQNIEEIAYRTLILNITDNVLR